MLGKPPNTEESKLLYEEFGIVDSDDIFITPLVKSAYAFRELKKRVETLEGICKRLGGGE